MESIRTGEVSASVNVIKADFFRQSKKFDGGISFTMMKEIPPSNL